MDEVDTTWPTLHPLRHQQNDATNRPAGNPRTPALPALLQAPVDHAPPQLQPNLYLQLSQILEWEIWNHNQTRGGLCSELTHRMQLEAQVLSLNNELAQWKEGCRIAYAALDEHRAENSNLKLDVEALTDELRHLRQYVQPGPTCAPPSCNETRKADNELLHQQLAAKTQDTQWGLEVIEEIRKSRESSK